MATRAKSTEFPDVVIRGADKKLYRRSAMGIFLNEDGFCLCFVPVGIQNKDFLQTVQGGVAKGETPKEALLREIGEEIGLAPEDVIIVEEILPVDENGETVPDTGSGSINDNNEVVDETRKVFRYQSKSWRKESIHGQELYPHLCFLSKRNINKIRLIPRNPEIRREFFSYKIGKLSSLYAQAPPSKREVLQHIVKATYPVARRFLADQRYNADNLGSVVELEHVVFSPRAQGPKGSGPPHGRGVKRKLHDDNAPTGAPH
ncbi:hypothetical protein STCU_01013 [Strigomonas culicis]|uniref:Nudix hydrolase domain-containing protein n=1 Tax=Strigomonas culicis TaxID=28005 RepID=S9W8V7_9TRYP|nr:hypothetical protein STCU_05266 [Strigomonas culicis]EPY35661.1 hypothetical protein STCU_01013 [Strigomonas culicis]|eukprot:EPY28170.1 hypothetical protein STCU_05266 [Strigomonas culicis]